MPFRAMPFLAAFLAQACTTGVRVCLSLSLFLLHCQSKYALYIFTFQEQVLQVQMLLFLLF